MNIIIIAFLFQSFLALLINNLSSSFHYGELLYIISIFIQTIFVVCGIIKSCKKRSYISIILSSYFLRVFLMFFDLYARHIFVLPNSGTDSEGFFLTALNLYNNIPTAKYTNYPPFLNLILDFWGPNRIMLQYLNVLISVLYIIILLRLLEKLISNSKIIAFGLILICFFSFNNLILSALLMRETISVFSTTLSLYLFISWFHSNKFSYFVSSLLITIPAVFLHSGYICIVIAYCIIYSIYSAKNNNFTFSPKCIIFVAIFSLISVIVLLSPQLVNKFLPYIPSNISSIGNKLFAAGGSDYLVNLDAHNLFEIIVYAPIRMIYFMFSPMPWDWRGLQDVFAFISSSLIVLSSYVISTVCIFNRKTLQKVRQLLCSLVFISLCVSIMFAWGVSNAGTAIRHREKFMPINIVMLCISLNNLKRRNIIHERILLNE